jgi:hypothetical protein
MIKIMVVMVDGCTKVSNMLALKVLFLKKITNHFKDSSQLAEYLMKNLKKKKELITLDMLKMMEKQTKS